MNREELRRDIPVRYSFVRHLGMVQVLAGVVLAAGALLVREPTRAELLIPPAGFLFANLFEFLIHRYGMHRRIRGLFVFYRRHTLQHHVFFHEDTMSVDGLRDMKYVLFPAWAFVAFVAMVAPTYAAVYVLVSPSACGLFILTTVGYYLLYEWLHMLYHLGERNPLRRLGPFRRIAEHHRVHHDPALMTRHNFNITFPIFDTLFGTTHRKGFAKEES